MKWREPRLKVMLPARLRAGADWSDACILDLSSRGMLVRASKAPSRGSYLEIRRGAYSIIARVIWAHGDRFGIQTQDVVPADGLIHNRGGTAGNGHIDRPTSERRAASRPLAPRHEAGRWRARAFEFGTFALVSMVAATLGLGAVDALLARPLDIVQTALGRR